MPEKYVLEGGSDSNPGTLTQPWATINKANTTLVAGDTVYLGPKTFFEDPINPSRNGLSGSPITYASYSEVTKPIISWGQTITDWTLHSGNVWKKVGYTRINANSWDNIWQGYQVLQGGLSAIPTAAGYYWYDSATSTLYVWCIGNANPNDVGLIGVPNDTAGAEHYGADLIGSRYINLKNIELKYVASFGVPCNNGSYLGFENMTCHYIGRKVIFLKTASNCVVDGGTYNYCSAAAYISNGGANNEIKNLTVNNVVEDCVEGSDGNGGGAPGIGNSIHHCDLQTGTSPRWWDTPEDAIDIYGGTFDVYDNTLHDTGARGIYIHGGDNHHIHRNRVYNTDWNGLYGWVGGPGYGTGTGWKLENNLFYRCGLGAGVTLYLHSTISGPEIYNNTIYAYHLGGLHLDSPNSVVKNNILTGYSGGSTIPTCAIYGATSSITSDYNLFYHFDSNKLVKWGATTYTDLASYQAASGQDAHSISSNPQFTNLATYDFHLTASSPCVDAAISTGAPVTDKEGKSRVDIPTVPNTGGGTYPYFDIGAYELPSYTPPPSGERSPAVRSAGGARTGVASRPPR